MKLPDPYAWVPALRGLPLTIRLALAEYGVQEVIGSGSNRTILAWRDELNLAGVKVAGYSDDSVPWCGLFAAIICYRRQKRPEEIPSSPLWARNWANYGVASPQASLGDILVFQRPSGGHVGFYVAEDATAYHVLGGNQSDKVCITRVAKARCIAVRRPPYQSKPQAVKPYRVESTGEISVNEQ